MKSRTIQFMAIWFLCFCVMATLIPLFRNAQAIFLLAALVRGLMSFAPSVVLISGLRTIFKITRMVK